MKNIPSLFATKVFNDSVMRTKLPKDTYKALKKTMDEGRTLELDIANVVANAMKEWALENGATHYTHWFQPMTGITAEKHDSFISPSGSGGIIMEFSGKELVKGEPDASSFPSGGLRATFEARGYTIWDTTSYAFIKDNSLCIPTAFCSYGGLALDKKTPLLRSMQAIEKQALRVLRLFGNTRAKKVVTTMGAEQEYFLIDEEIFKKRPDLVTCSRTLFGAKPPKGQELDDHYFGILKPRVSAFMKELDEELWALGVLSKTKHNEAAPSQHELAPVFTTANIATDHNQLTMEMMKSVASRHKLVCVLHEKPFAGVNGSGKHNNWSISTDYGSNLLEPGETPHENARFLLFLVAVIKAVDTYQDLLRLSVASAGNDHRLGGAEAPPAIISMFLGEELTEILSAIECGEEYVGKERKQLQIGAKVLPHIPIDSTDRNRTSPFAFTGNKFEFRMPGSSISVAGPNIMLNTAVAEALCGFADELEGKDNFNEALTDIIKRTVKEHARIVYNGNNYTHEWEQEAERRGLSNSKTTVDALMKYIDEKNIALFEKHNVFSGIEVHSRYEILLENYNKTVNIEALTMLDMVKKSILPASFAYQSELVQLISTKKNIGIEGGYEESLVKEINKLTTQIATEMQLLSESLQEAQNELQTQKKALLYKSAVCKSMENLRVHVDSLECIVAKKHWPYPCYSELLYSV